MKYNVIETLWNLQISLKVSIIWNYAVDNISNHKKSLSFLVKETHIKLDENTTFLYRIP